MSIISQHLQLPDSLFTAAPHSSPKSPPEIRRPASAPRYINISTTQVRGFRNHPPYSRPHCLFTPPFADPIPTPSLESLSSQAYNISLPPLFSLRRRPRFPLLTTTLPPRAIACVPTCSLLLRDPSSFLLPSLPLPIDDTSLLPLSMPDGLRFLRVRHRCVIYHPPCRPCFHCPLTLHRCPLSPHPIIRPSHLHLHVP